MSTCIAPPPLDDLELLRFLDGEAEPSAQAHVEACGFCRGRADELRRQEARLRARLHRIACPDSQELGEFHLGRLERRRSDEVRRHLSTCPLCTDELSQLPGFLEALPPGAEIPRTTRRRTLVARLLDLGREGVASLPSLAPAWAVARGPGASARVYQTEDLQVAVEVQPGSGLLGLVIGAEPSDWMVHLWQGDRHVGQVTPDSLGNFAFEDVHSGTYDIVLVGPDEQVHIPSMEI